jgi:hypothetical protein
MSLEPTLEEVRDVAMGAPLRLQALTYPKINSRGAR